MSDIGQSRCVSCHKERLCASRKWKVCDMALDTSIVVWISVVALMAYSSVLVLVYLKRGVVKLERVDHSSLHI